MLEINNKVPIKLRCPICNRQKQILISKDIIDQNKSGIISVFIAGLTICEHSFYIYIDKQLRVRDYLVADISITDQDDIIKIDKQKILKELLLKDLTGQNLFKFISEKDYQLLLCACFINTEIIFIENNLFIYESDNDQFKFVFASLMQLFPENYNLIRVISLIKFKDYQELNTEKIDSSVYVLNGKVFANDIVYSNIFDKVIKALKQGNYYIQQEISKKIINKFKEFSEYIKKKINILPENKILKILQKKFKKEEITPNIIKLIKKRFEIPSDYKRLSEIEPNSTVYVRNVFNDKLMVMGFTRGAKINIISNNRGSVTVKIINTKIALGLTAANQIFVKQY